MQSVRMSKSFASSDFNPNEENQIDIQALQKKESELQEKNEEIAKLSK
jgi:hypothetical protein